MRDLFALMCECLARCVLGADIVAGRNYLRVGVIATRVRPVVIDFRLDFWISLKRFEAAFLMRNTVKTYFCTIHTKQILRGGHKSRTSDAKIQYS